MTDLNHKRLQAGFLYGFDSWAHLLRFCIATLFIFGLIIILAWVIISNVGSEQRLSIAFNPEGSTIISINKQPSKALVLLSAGQLWLNTGLKLKPGQRIRVTTSGRINLAIHRLVEAAVEDVRPRHGWVGPEGDQLKNEKPVDRLRKKLRIEPRVGYGCLLAYIKPEGEPDPGKDNPKPSGIQVIGSNSELTYRDNQEREGTLFLTVNEAVIQDDQESEQAYVTTQEALDETYGPGKIKVETLRRQWCNLVKDNYWDVWTDDNVGAFLVQISYEPSDE